METIYLRESVGGPASLGGFVLAVRDADGFFYQVDYHVDACGGNFEPRTVVRVKRCRGPVPGKHITLRDTYVPAVAQALRAFLYDEARETAWRNAAPRRAAEAARREAALGQSLQKAQQDAAWAGLRGAFENLAHALRDRSRRGRAVRRGHRYA